MDSTELTWEVLQQYACLAEDWIPKNASIAIALGDRFVYFFSGQNEIQSVEGQPVPVGSVAGKVVKTRKKIACFEDDSLFGKGFYGVGYPVDIQGEQGALVVILPPEVQSARYEPLEFLTGKLDDEWYPVPVAKVTHIESFQKKTFFYTDGEQYSIGCTLKELSARLPSPFLRVHRSYIVNTACIHRVSKDFSSNLILTLLDETILPVSQSYVNEVKCVLGF